MMKEKEKNSRRNKGREGESESVRREGREREKNEDRKQKEINESGGRKYIGLNRQNVRYRPKQRIITGASGRPSQSSMDRTCSDTTVVELLYYTRHNTTNIKISAQLYPFNIAVWSRRQRDVRSWKARTQKSEFRILFDAYIGIYI